MPLPLCCLMLHNSGGTSIGNYAYTYQWPIDQEWSAKAQAELLFGLFIIALSLPKYFRRVILHVLLCLLGSVPSRRSTFLAMRTLLEMRRTAIKSRGFRVQTPCSESPVLVPARTTLMNDRIDDTRCVATTRVPQLRANAASAKCENRMTGKSAICEFAQPQSSHSRRMTAKRTATAASRQWVGCRLWADCSFRPRVHTMKQPIGKSQGQINLTISEVD